MNTYHAAHLSSDPYYSSSSRKTVVTETPTTKGSSRLVTGSSSDLRTPGHGRKFWTARDPELRLGNIAAPRQSWRQRKRRGGGMRRLEARGSPKNVRRHSPVRYIAAPRIGRARVSIEPGAMKPAQRIWSPARFLGPGYMTPAPRMVSPVRQHSPVRAIPPHRTGLATGSIQPAPVTLDPNTSHPHLILSDDLTSVRYSDEKQQLPDNPERFDEEETVLGFEGFNSGTHSWDIDVGENIYWYLGVITESVQRKGDSGYWDGSWGVLFGGGDYKTHVPKQPLTPLTVRQNPQRIRVQLDWEGGKLSFSDPVNNTHLHTFTHTFTERVLPFICTGFCPLPLRVLPGKVSVSVDTVSV
ncbi:E3 ubiquitin-protein ligase TRIM15-like [Oncorhynchus masou masou]|uniref:E3 ubiquitin-protein ligase TRIM15-like n=1 Tax=Oncorhynchus masou masou TaxID=90313 RepID=UPI00318415BB